jgi:hypothetical protein
MNSVALYTRCRRLALVGLVLLACVQSTSAETWKFLVYGDSRGPRITGGVHTEILADLAAATVAERPDLVLFTGDLAGMGSPAAFTAWKSVMQPVYDAGIPVLPVAGNHDLPDLGALKSMFLAPLTAHPPQGVEDLVLDATDSDGRSYAFRYRGALFLALDEYGDNGVHTHAVNQAFVDAQLADATQTVTHTWVRRVAAGSFQDVPDSIFTYSDTSRRWMHLWLGVGLVLAGAILVVWNWRKLHRCGVHAPQSAPGATGFASVPTSIGEASASPPLPPAGPGSGRPPEDRVDPEGG